MFKVPLTYYPKLSVLLWFACFFTIHAQNNVYKHYTTEEGLPHDITYQIIQDSQGYIWIGTDDGLVKFNGKTFLVYGSEKGLKSNYVIDIIEDVPNKQFLIATWGRGIHILKNDSIYKNESSATDYSKINKIYKLNDSLVYGDSGNSKQVFYNIKKYQINVKHVGYDHDTLLVKSKVDFKKILRDTHQNFINDTLYLHHSELNIATKDQLKGVYVFENFSYKKINLKKLNNKYVHSLTKDNGYFIAASYNHLFFYDVSKFLEKRTLQLPEGKIIQMQLFKSQLYFVFINKANGLRELYCYNIYNNFLTNISQKLAIKSSISDFLFDKDANLWLTTYGSGVYQILHTNNAFYGKNYFINPDLRDIAFHDNGIISIAPNIIYSIQNDTLIDSKRIPFHTETFQLLKNQEIDVIVPNKINGSYQDRWNNYVLRNKNFKAFNFSFKGVNIYLTDYSYTIKKENHIINKGTFHSVYGSYLLNAIQDKEYIYALFGRLGIYRLNVLTGEVIQWNEAMGINANMFTDLVIHNQTYWVGTNSGVYKINSLKKNHYTTNHGLLSNHVNDLFIDKFGVLWTATQKGLNVLKKTTFYSVDKNLGQESSSVKKIVEHNDYIYAVGNKGLFKYDNLYPFNNLTNTTLKVSQQNTQFTIAPINFVNPNTLKIQYQLNKDTWATLLNEKISFKNLAQDNYQVVFRYKDGLSNWIYTKPYYFKIVYPWHQQLWFYTLLIVLGAGTIVLLIYNQLLKSRKKNKIFQQTLLEREKLQEDLKNVRHQIAQDFHDDLGNKLASISMLSNLSLKKTTKESNLYPSLHQINKDANFLYAGMRDFVWSLDYKNNELKEVQLYLNDFGEKLFEFSNINFKSSNNVSKLEVTLPHYWNKQLVLVFKEAMTNTLKHSKATEVVFSVNLKNAILEIKLEDNGIGYDINTVGRKNGLRNMKERIEFINGELNFTNHNGFGVYFKGKINK
ncbi:two-component regulator propeller domain-containing protein [Tenacibaculum sp. 190524A02b]|uniref:ligand-binding sensor domain-containing protein n=1 Tax=Tenacibaculum vairaonense TaxID=3137860 RepID=UPI0031FA53F5